LAASQDLTQTRGFSDQEIQDAIEELKRSTAAIEKESAALRLQQTALSTLMKNNTRAAEARAYTEKSQQQKWNMEKAHISSAVRVLSVHRECLILTEFRSKSYLKVCGIKHRTSNNNPKHQRRV
jgi:hypothetical protein